MSDKPSTTLPATVEKIIKPPSPSEPEKAQIAVEGADHLYRELRIENTLTDENGDKVRLKQGAEVEVTIEAEPEATIPKSDGKETDGKTVNRGLSLAAPARTAILHASLMGWRSTTVNTVCPAQLEEWHSSGEEPRAASRWRQLTVRQICTAQRPNVEPVRRKGSTRLLVPTWRPSARRPILFAGLVPTRGTERIYWQRAASWGCRRCGCHGNAPQRSSAMADVAGTGYCHPGRARTFGRHGCSATS